jgi:hypothetical protein
LPFLRFFDNSSLIGDQPVSYFIRSLSVSGAKIPNIDASSDESGSAAPGPALRRGSRRITLSFLDKFALVWRSRSIEKHPAADADRRTSRVLPAILKAFV